MPLHAPFICALWSPAGKGLTSWLSFVVSNCEFVTFPLVSSVRCGTHLKLKYWIEFDIPHSKLQTKNSKLEYGIGFDIYHSKLEY